MKKALSIALALLLCAIVVPADASNSDPDAVIFKVYRSQGYVPTKSALQAYLKDRSARSGRHLVCVIGYVIKRPTDPVAFKVAWVYWPRGNRLVSWEPAAEGFDSSETLIRSRRDLDLATDVVETDADIGSSTYLVSRPWVDMVLNDCKRRGNSYRLRVR